MLRLIAAVLALVVSGAAFGQSNTIVNYKNGTNAVQVSPTAGLPVNVVAGSGSGCAGTAGTPCITNVQNWGAGAGVLGAMANYGTSPGAVLVPGVNAFVTNTNPNGQATMANSSPVVISSNQSAVPIALGTTATVNDPCKTSAKITSPISQAASGVIITHSGTLTTYICGGSFNISDAESVSLTEGTGVTCGTGAAALMGSTTVANGMALSANEGMSFGNGNASNIISKTAGDDICILQSGTGRLAGWVTFVQQ